MYCNTYDTGGETGVPSSKFNANANLRVIPYLLSQQNEFFTLTDTKFTMEQYKAASARQIFFKELRIKNSFTLENSFFKRYTKRERKDN